MFIEGRGGNTSPAYKMDRTLTSCFKLLKVNGVLTEHLRCDSAAYQQSVVKVAEKNCINFFIPINEYQNLRDDIKD